MDTNMTASATMPAANAAAPVKKNSNFQAIVKRLFQNRGAVIGLIIFIVLALAAIFAPVAAPYGYEEMDLTNMLSGPSLEHLFGTDELGRDVFSRIIYGGRYSLSIGLAATAFGAVVGCAIGAITGYFGGTLDTVLMRFLDILEAIPGLLLTICVSAVLGSGFDKTFWRWRSHRFHSMSACCAPRCSAFATRNISRQPSPSPAASSALSRAMFYRTPSPRLSSRQR